MLVPHRTSVTNHTGVRVCCYISQSHIKYVDKGVGGPSHRMGFYNLSDVFVSKGCVNNNKKQYLKRSQLSCSYVGVVGRRFQEGVNARGVGAQSCKQLK